MITISKTTAVNENGTYEFPSRALTKEEEFQSFIDDDGVTRYTNLSRIIAKWGDSNNYWYFTNEDKDNNTPEWQAYQNYLNPVPTLAEYKIQKNGKIDYNSSVNLIVIKGFDFDNRNFSLSQNAQNKIGLFANGLALGLITEANFPYPFSDKNDNIYMLQWNDRFLFLGSAALVIQTALQTGGALKNQVNFCDTKEQVDAIIDDRT